MKYLGSYFLIALFFYTAGLIVGDQLSKQERPPPGKAPAKIESKNINGDLSPRRFGPRRGVVVPLLTEV